MSLPPRPFDPTPLLSMPGPFTLTDRAVGDLLNPFSSLCYLFESLIETSGDPRLSAVSRPHPPEFTFRQQSFYSEDAY